MKEMKTQLILFSLLLLGSTAWAQQPCLSQDAYREKVEAYSQILKQQKLKTLASSEARKIAHTGFLPKIDVNADGTLNMSDLSAWNEPVGEYRNHTYQGVFVVSQPLYTGGALNAQHQIAKADEKLNQLNEELTLDQIHYQSDAVYWNASASKAMLQAADKYQSIVKQQYDIIQDRFDDGMISRTDLLMISTRLKEAELQYIKARQNYTLALQQLNILMGEAPTMTDAVPSNDGAELAALSRQIVFEKAALLEAVEPYRTLRLENETGSLTNHYIYQLRMDQDCSWLFIAVGEPAGNPDFVKKDPVNIVLNGRFTVKEYDTMTGRIRDVKTAKRGAQTVVNHIFYNQSSLLLKLMPVGEASGSVQAAAANDATQAAGVPGAMQAVSGASSTAESCAACGDSALAAALREQLLASGAAPKALPNRVAVTLSEPNVLLLDRAEFCMDDGAYQPAQELLRADNVLRSQLGFPARGGEVAQPWVLPEEKTEHFATLRFTIESEVEVPVRLALEEAEHASVKLNGKTVNEKVSGWYTDHCIGTIEIGTLQKGTNIVEATVPFTHRIGLEWCYLLGDFGVRIEGRAGVVTAPVRALSFGDIVPQGLPFYGGNITYHLPVSIGANGAVVHIPHYRGALVAVEKDGKRLGETTFAPYDLEVGQADSIDLVLFGNRVNTFGAVHMVGEDDRFLNPGSWRTQDDDWSEEYVLQKVGILSAPVIVLNK